MTLLVALACTGGTESAAGCDTAAVVSWANFADGFFSNYCRACHSAESAYRYDAPESVNFDTEAEVRDWADRIRARAIDEQDMPVGGGVYAGDIELLDTYLRCWI
jgi:uncharacterized membrane protein